MSVYLVLVAIVVCAASGLPACFFSRTGMAGQRITVALIVIGSLLGLAGAIGSVCGGALDSVYSGAYFSISASWFLPWGRFDVGLDALSAVFLVLVFLVPALGSVYALEYWRQTEHPENGQRLGLFIGLLTASMAMVVIARDGVLFLFAWETMALSAYFAATTDERSAEVRRAGWIYLVATHLGTMCLLAMFALWRSATGSFALTATDQFPQATAAAVFILAMVGFGCKAGLMPLHVWLPGAHANAPSHVSALMSGVMLKMGIYGLVRTISLIPSAEAWWGWTLLVAGVLSGVAGIAFAIGQTDMKRLLAYSSIENVGIIVMGIGLAVLGRALGAWDWVVLGMGGAVLHVVNHGLFKPLLFFNVGAILHATGTRDMEDLGGLSKRMPRCATLFLFGAVAICALPPLNGFIGEWLIYGGLFRTIGLSGDGGAPMASMAVAALAMIGAMAVVCFVKLFGTIFLGQPRSGLVDRAHDPGAFMILPMAALALACLCIGLAPRLVIPVVDAAVAAWSDTTVTTKAELSVAVLAPVDWIGWLGIVLLIATVGLFLAQRLLSRCKPQARSVTWDCGYARPDARMQYSGTSFVRSVVQLCSFLLRPRDKGDSIDGDFPGKTAFRSAVPDAVLDRCIVPLIRRIGSVLPKFRVLQRGHTHWYLLYVLVIAIVLLVFGGVGMVP